MLKRPLLAGAAFLASAMVAGSAFAADPIFAPEPAPAPIPAPAPVMTWHGFYVGLHAGYTWGDVDVNTTYLPSPAAFGAVPFSSSIDMDGFLGGAQVGFNWQMDAFVFGVEADISWSGADGSTTLGPLRVGAPPGVPFPGSLQTTTADMDWFGTARVRAGFAAAPEVLLYVTGGLAWAKIDYTSFTAFAPPGPSAINWVGSHSTSKAGWTVGGGAEFALSQNWSAKLEYLYYDLGSSSHVANPQLPNPPFQVSQSFDTSGHIVRAGLNYRFSW